MAGYPGFSIRSPLTASWDETGTKKNPGVLPPVFRPKPPKAGKGKPKPSALTLALSRKI